MWGVGGYLGGHGVRARGKDLGYAGNIEASLGQAKGGPQPRPTSSDDHGIKRMVHNRVRRPRARKASPKHPYRQALIKEAREPAAPDLSEDTHSAPTVLRNNGFIFD